MRGLRLTLQEELARSHRLRAARNMPERHQHYRPCLVVITGLSGTGKSTVARALAQRTGFSCINSDEIRKELAGLPLTTRPRGPYGGDIYTYEFSQRTYRTLFERAELQIAAGGVILDATFQLAVGRQTARDIANSHAVPFLLIECRCSEEEVRRRLARRSRQGTDASDADWTVYLEQRKRFEPFDENSENDRLILNTEEPLETLLAKIERRLPA